jgi:hypothetical protein
MVPNPATRRRDRYVLFALGIAGVLLIAVAYLYP